MQKLRFYLSILQILFRFGFGLDLDQLMDSQTVIFITNDNNKIDMDMTALDSIAFSLPIDNTYTIYTIYDI